MPHMAGAEGMGAGVHVDVHGTGLCMHGLGSRGCGMHMHGAGMVQGCAVWTWAGAAQAGMARVWANGHGVGMHRAWASVPQVWHGKGRWAWGGACVHGTWCGVGMPGTGGTAQAGTAWVWAGTARAGTV